MLHAEDITVGDWCRRRSIYQDTGREVVTDFQITQICKNGENLYVYGPKGNMGRVDQIEPIPLTPEILEKNGFKDSEFFGELLYKDWQIMSDCEHLAARCRDGWNFDIPCKFVHELQHALRLCGIEKEIEL